MAIPVATALLGPFVARYAPAAPQAPFGPSDWSCFGTDRLGRDVLAAVLTGGRPMLLTVVLTVAAAYAAGFVLGIVAAAARRPWMEDAIMRPIDVLLCLPVLLVVMVAALRSDGSGLAIAVAVGFMLVAPITRFVRMAARRVVQSPAMEALRMQGATAGERYIGYALRHLARPVVADVGVRLMAAIYVLASANFLGIGFDTTSTDWAVSVAANKDGLSTAPWSVYLPATLIVSLVLGLNLFCDAILADPTRRDLLRTHRD
ncbi:ABC transporter permease [[Mycobacterium] fortunisiensis]|uniref:ABC transporter permease n=1 Tax=[Mycobacterium] fortunisiensis TaxID=2600579 RepID=UPI0027E03B4C|nr:ABC transporter permease subunit [[Mycobacterium] fortunisiensis]